MFFTTIFVFVCVCEKNLCACSKMWKFESVWSMFMGEWGRWWKHKILFYFYNSKNQTHILKEYFCTFFCKKKYKIMSESRSGGWSERDEEKEKRLGMETWAQWYITTVFIISFSLSFAFDEFMHGKRNLIWENLFFSSLCSARS